MKNWRKELLSILENSGFSKLELAVYKAVLKIPRGETRSYSQIAAQIKRPKAARAVANALNKNPFPIIIPCYRVIKKDGSLGGYSGGVKLKKKLLEMEKDKTCHRPA